MSIPTKSYDFNSLLSCGAVTDEKIKQKFATFEELAEANLKDFEDLENVGPTRAVKLLQLARDIVKQTKESKDVSGKVNLNNLVIDPDDVKDSEEEETSKEEYIVVSKRIDQYSLRRTKVRYHRGISKLTGVDICALNKLPPYDELDSDATKLAVLDAVRRHELAFRQKVDIQNLRIEETSDMLRPTGV